MYKLVLHNSLNSIFRTELQKKGDLSHARSHLDRLYADYENGIPLKRTLFRTDLPVTNNDFFDANDIYNHLKANTDQVLVRVGACHSLILYSNNKNLLTSLGGKLRTKDVEFFEPSVQDKEFLLSNDHTVIVSNKPKFSIRCILGRKKASKELGMWLENNKDKSKVGKIALETLLNSGYANGLYFYVRDEKVLQLVTLICGDNIRKIEKLVWKQELDKY